MLLKILIASILFSMIKIKSVQYLVDPILDFSKFRTDSDKNLVDLLLDVPEGSTVINATLTDINGSRKYFIQELISASDSIIKSKIKISSDKDSYSIHYNAASSTGVDSKERLVIHGSDCLLLTYKNKWDKNLPGIREPLLNLILLIGPSIIYRIDHSSFVWKEVADKNVRGVMLKGITTDINQRLKITYYFKKYLDAKHGIEDPSRIEFKGYNPDSNSNDHKENLILDVYFKDTYGDDQSVQNEVQPLPGIGCPHYLSENKAWPSLKSSHLHYTMYEHSQDSTSRSFNQIYVAQDYHFLRWKTTLLGVTKETIYDYGLGVSFILGSDGSCNVLSLDSNLPGIGSYGSFSLYYLFQFNFPYKYLGSLNLDQRSGIHVEAWESVQYNVTISGEKIDKAVITQYFIASQPKNLFNGYTLISTKISIYKYDPSRKVFTLKNVITKDFLNFHDVEIANEFQDTFTLIKQCKYLTSNKRLTINFVLECDESDRSYDYCIKHTESRINWLKKFFIQDVISYKTISFLRIDDLQYRFTDSKVEMEVTFVDLPDLKYIFKSQTMSVSPETLKATMKIAAQTADECLENLSQHQDPISVVIFNPSNHMCGYLDSADELKEDTKQGQTCIVYRFPLNNLRRIKQELSLDQIHDRFLQNADRRFSFFDGDKFITFKVVDVIDTTQKDADIANSNLAYRIRTGAKLRVDDQFAVAVPNAKTFADCYRNCHNSEKLRCNSFSFCQKGDCRVSSWQAADIISADTHENDINCSIFSPDTISDYSEVENRRFKSQFSAAIQTDVNSCAKSCHSSPDCTSFQFCYGSCTFNGFYTDSATEYDEKCVVYFPKALEKYQKTGDKIVSDVFITETKLTLEQCASLCDGWSDGETRCQSFNYCPKSKAESSCLLTQFSVKSFDTKTVEGSGCSNYELKPESKASKTQEISSSEVIIGMSGSGAFGIIILFLLFGASMGFISPYAYSKVKRIFDDSKNQETFNWTRQLDERPESSN